MGAQTVIRRAQNQGVTPVREVYVSTGTGALIVMDSREVGELREQGFDVEILEFVPVAPVAARGVSLAKASDAAPVAPVEERQLPPRVQWWLPIGAEAQLRRNDLRALAATFDVMDRMGPVWGRPTVRPWR